MIEDKKEGKTAIKNPPLDNSYYSTWTSTLEGISNESDGNTLQKI